MNSTAASSSFSHNFCPDGPSLLDLGTSCSSIPSALPPAVHYHLEGAWLVCQDSMSHTESSFSFFFMLFVMKTFSTYTEVDINIPIFLT